MIEWIVAEAAARLMGRRGPLFGSCGMLILNGTGAWVRSGNRQFDLTWIYPVVSTIDGSYIGEFKDLARINLNDDGTMTGVSTFAFTLADGTVAFAGSQKVKMVRLRVEPMP